MSTEVFQIFNESGGLMLDSAWPVISFKYKALASTDTASYNHLNNGLLRVVCYAGNTIWHYYFEMAEANTSPGGMGLELYNANGVRTFSSNNYPLRLLQRVIVNEGNAANIALPSATGGSLFGVLYTGEAVAGYATNFRPYAYGEYIDWQYDWISIFIEPYTSGSYLRFRISTARDNNLWSTTSLVLPVDNYLRLEGYMVDLTGL